MKLEYLVKEKELRIPLYIPDYEPPKKDKKKKKKRGVVIIDISEDIRAKYEI